MFRQIVVDRGKLNYRAKYSKNRFKAVNCRCGFNLLETPSHVFLYCPVTSPKLLSLRSLCFDLGVDNSLETLFTDSRLQVDMEKFQQDFIPDGFG